VPAFTSLSLAGRERKNLLRPGDTYTMYFNDQLPGVNATRITDATNVWNQQVSDSSPEIMKMASCYAEKSYYSW